MVIGATQSCHTILESSCQAKQHCLSRFLILDLGLELQVSRGGPGGVCNFFRISQFCIKHEINFFYLSPPGGGNLYKIGLNNFMGGGVRVGGELECNGVVSAF